MPSIQSRQVVKRFTSSEDDVERQLADELKQVADLANELNVAAERSVKPGSIVKGRVVEVRKEEVLVDFRSKSEGTVSLAEFGERVPAVGEEVEVFLEDGGTARGLPELSKRKADR